MIGIIRDDQNYHEQLADERAKTELRYLIRLLTKLFVQPSARCPATIAARTASTADRMSPGCRTAKNLRLVLPSTGDDQE